jgi:hypothetical protein
MLVESGTENRDENARLALLNLYVADLPHAETLKH